MLGAGCQYSRGVTSSPESDTQELAGPVGQVSAILDNIQQWSAPINMGYRPAGVSTVMGSSAVESSDSQDSITTLEAVNHPVRPPLAGDLDGSTAGPSDTGPPVELTEALENDGIETDLIFSDWLNYPESEADGS